MSPSEARAFIARFPQTQLGYAGSVLVAEIDRLEGTRASDLEGEIAALRAEHAKVLTTNKALTREVKITNDTLQIERYARARAETHLEAQVAERERLGKELEAARVPSQEMARLRGLEAAVLGIFAEKVRPLPHILRLRERLLHLLGPWLPQDKLYNSQPTPTSAIT